MTNNPLTALIVLLVVLVVADIITSVKILNAGGRERNKFLRSLINKFGVYPVVVGTHVAVIAGIFYVGMAWPAWMLTGLCVVYGVALVNNLMVMKKQGLL